MITSPTIDKNCPVLQQAESVLTSANHLRNQVSKLRRSLQACNSCPNSGECIPLQQFNRQINAAIDALAEDWGLV